MTKHRIAGTEVGRVLSPAHGALRLMPRPRRGAGVGKLARRLTVGVAGVLGLLAANAYVVGL